MKKIKQMFFYMLIDKKLYEYHQSKTYLYKSLLATIIETARQILRVPIPSKLFTWYCLDFLDQG